MSSVTAIEMQQCDFALDCEQPASHLTSLLQERRGKESMIADYCRNAIKSNNETCIWLCIRQARRYSLVDVPLGQNEEKIGLQAIRKKYSWWKRYSLYSVVAVKEVMVSIIGMLLRSRPDSRQGSHPCF
jgi:hypothetical protein